MHLFDQNISWLELTGTVFGIAGVWLTVRKNRWCFPVGMINVGLYAWLFFSEKLYADSFLQLVYIVLLAYGWIHWSRESQSGIIITRSAAGLIKRITLIIIGSSVLLGFLLHQLTDAALPYFDSLLTAMSLAAQWMVARKKIENWILWIIADALYILMYIYKDLYLTAFLYFIFILLAAAGWISWKKSLSSLASNASR